MRPSVGFLIRVLALVGVLFALWSFAGVGDAYGRAVVAVARPLMRLASGFDVERVDSTEHGLDVVIRRDQIEEVMPFQPRELFSGVITFLALVGASTMVPWRRRLRAAGIGLAALFVFHMGLIVLGPYMTGHPQAQLGVVWMRRINSVINVFYGFYGLVGYAALPFLLWWVLVQRYAPAAEPSDAPTAPAAKRRARR
ncbi:MAG TPA: hypothetical protein VL049_02945 [Candidatus Dormibacteraeota bacterium]|nr:hypothetical protein [Candidatus Dormibacteraeota bacterium]